jgi:anti-anti-sigma regulatory factor
MSDPRATPAPPTPPGGAEVAVIYAGDYVNKLSGQRIERECLLRLRAGCRALVINFRGTELVNSIGVSILLGVIDEAEQMGTRVVFSHVNRHTCQLFELLGLTRHVALAETDEAALDTLSEFSPPIARGGH